MKKKIWGFSFLTIGVISILSFILLPDENYKMLILGIITFFVGITELFISAKNESEVEKKNAQYAKKAAEATLYSLFFVCIAGIILLFFNNEISRDLSAIQILEIVVGYISSCYLITYFIIKIKEGKK